MAMTIVAIFVAVKILLNAHILAVAARIWAENHIYMCNPAAPSSPTPDKSIAFVWKIAIAMRGSEFDFNLTIAEEGLGLIIMFP